MRQIKKNQGFKDEKSIVFPRLFLSSATGDPLVDSIYPTDIGFYPHAQYHFRDRPQGCDQNILIYCIGGEGFFILEGIKHKIEKDTLLIISKGTRHTYGASKTNPWSIYWLHFLGSNANSYLRNIKVENPMIHYSVEKSSKVMLLFEDIFRVLEKGFTQEAMIYSSQVVANILGTLFFQTPNLTSVPRETALQVEESIFFMTMNLKSILTLKDLADQANLSPTHYSYLFKKRTGYSPIDYFLRLKIKSACQYLDTTRLKVNEISQLLGFNDPYYFSRAFYKIMQMSPTAYRAVMKG
ncbi:MAG: AraC family transcriptional regulator [Eubacterium sp.]|nr:AraC family transcriptional regulator [Eubacterium sp.]